MIACSPRFNNLLIVLFKVFLRFNQSVGGQISQRNLQLARRRFRVLHGFVKFIDVVTHGFNDLCELPRRFALANGFLNTLRKAVERRAVVFKARTDDVINRRRDLVRIPARFSQSLHACHCAFQIAGDACNLVRLLLCPFVIKAIFLNGLLKFGNGHSIVAGAFNQAACALIHPLRHIPRRPGGRDERRAFDLFKALLHLRSHAFKAFLGLIRAVADTVLQLATHAHAVAPQILRLAIGRIQFAAHLFQRRLGAVELDFVIVGRLGRLAVFLARVLHRALKAFDNLLLLGNFTPEGLALGRQKRLLIAVGFKLGGSELQLAAQHAQAALRLAERLFILVFTVERQRCANLSLDRHLILPFARVRAPNPVLIVVIRPPRQIQIHNQTRRHALGFRPVYAGNQRVGRTAPGSQARASFFLSFSATTSISSSSSSAISRFMPATNARDACRLACASAFGLRFLARYSSVGASPPQ